MLTILVRLAALAKFSGMEAVRPNLSQALDSSWWWGRPGLPPRRWPRGGYACPGCRGSHRSLHQPIAQQVDARLDAVSSVVIPCWVADCKPDAQRLQRRSGNWSVKDVKDRAAALSR
jgi:hypothetical protein